MFVGLAVLVGVVAGWVSAPGHDANALPMYRATHTLILNPTISTKVFNLDQAALLVTTGAIPQNVATKIGSGTDPAKLAKKVQPRPNVLLGTIDITASDTDPNFAVALADDFAQALVDDLSHDGLLRYQTAHDSLQATVDSLQAQLDAFQPPPDPRVPSAAKSQYDALAGQLQTASAQLFQSNAAGPPQPTLTTLQSARAIIASNGGLKAPEDKPARAALLGLLGLFLGIGLAFAAERLETRLTTKTSAEQALGLPVVAEIPTLPSARRHEGELMTATQPSAPFVESYRGLRTMVLLRALDQAHLEAGAATPDAARTGKVLVVVSPGAGEGKTTTVAHLAALLAEAGHSVLVVSADFRRPRVHELFAVKSAPGLTEVLGKTNPLPLRSLNLSTPVKGVKLLASGAAVDNPAPFLGATVELMRGARPLFDYVIVDTAPLLVANDASELIRAADMVLVVVRARKTTLDACGRAAELLRRIDAPAIGTVLVGASDMPTAYRYYRYRYYTASQPPSLWQRLRGGQASDDGRIQRAEEEPPRRGRRNAEEPADLGPRRSARKGRRRGTSAPAPPAWVDEVEAPEEPEPSMAPEPSAAGAPTNGSNGPHSDESLAEFWQEFKERR
ncbi:MAG: hypothetical protein QOD92_3771 [Acidimicrobiaceae bacterium]|jgi:capsular exopolysaccharide synthesis family protein